MSDIQRYWREGFPHVAGWVHPGLLPYVELIDVVQRQASIVGNVAEIGVFQGKFLIALASLLDSGGKATALDVFDDQSKNLDGAGQGDLGKLRDNIALYAKIDIDWRFLKADSSALSLLDKVDLIRERGPIRLFSIDGCHTTEHTLNDLYTAQDCCTAGGVIILDDYMQPHWPGVTHAASIFCGQAPRFVPFLYAHHKLFLVGVGWHAHFHQRCMEAFGSMAEAKLTSMFGSPVLSIFP